MYLLPARYAERPRAGLFFPATPAGNPPEPPAKRTVVVIEGEDLSEAPAEIRAIAREQSGRIKIA